MFASPGHPGYARESPPTARRGTSCRRIGPAWRRTSEGCRGRGRADHASREVRAVPPDRIPAGRTQLEHARMGTDHACDAQGRRARTAPLGRTGSGRGGRRSHDHPGESRSPLATDSTRWRSAARRRRRSTRTWARRRSRPGTDEEVEKLRVGGALGRRHGHGPVDRRGSRRLSRGDHPAHSTVPIGTVPIYSMIIGRRLEDLDERDHPGHRLEHQARAGRRLLHDPCGRAAGAPAAVIADRLIGIVSRGGSLLAKWMLHHGSREPDVRAVGRHLRGDARVET